MTAIVTGTNSALLRGKIELLTPGFFALTARLWNSPALAELYPRYLVLLHTAIRATVPLMDLALERATALAPEDEVAAGLVDYLTRHRREERGHDDWVREDLLALGRPADELLGAMPGTAVANLVGAQYYWIRHHHPVCLLGHIAVLEGYPPSPELTGLLRERTGFPAAAFRTLHRHAALDIRHRDELLRLLDELPLTAEHHRALGVSALHTLQTATVLFDELLATESRLV
ncbi:iron-containing redox enzyme family protein [Kitasatospora azatica]|uniref:iron-containing redox enzyme family protein n=1 Tax=Kitasatospora azatica TaxID=58347 RepID=UPI00056B8BFD|nr:iron-containing redox enzyme family protein [Kitasatospora azatica]